MLSSFYSKLMSSYISKKIEVAFHFQKEYIDVLFHFQKDWGRLPFPKIIEFVFNLQKYYVVFHFKLSKSNNQTWIELNAN